jgi:PhnB protein
VGFNLNQGNTMQLQPYLNFDGRCDEAIAFYRRAIGAEVKTMMRFKEAPDQSMVSPGNAEKVMHSSLQVGDTTIMASDGRCQGNATFSGISLTLTASSEPEAQKLFGGLADGGQVQMPLTKTFFSPAFGMLADRFGVTWMVIVQ